MARYLLSGAAGFIGARVARNLLDSDSIVVGIDNINDSYDPRLKEWRLEQFRDDDRFTLKRINIANRDELERALGDESYDGVINLAARAGVRQSVSDPWVYYETNVIGVLNLLDACRDRSIPKLVQASTSSLYGLNNPRPYKEDADTSQPLSPYAASKGAAEMLCHSYHHLHEMDITILRYFTVYGPAGRPDMSVFRFIQWIAEGRPLVLYGDGLQERDFTFVDDIARGTVAALRPLGFEVVNLGGDRPVKMMDVISMIEERLGKSADIDQRETAPADMPSTWADIHKAQMLLDWRPEVSLETGLEAAISWYLQERDWAESIPTTD